MAKPSDRWWLYGGRWVEYYYAGVLPRLVLKDTPIKINNFTFLQERMPYDDIIQMFTL
jgi:uncharacterized protein (DUF2237 family)